MVNSKKNTKSIIALVVLSLLLIASICLAATGAWFIDSKNQPGKTVNFGEVAISADGSLVAVVDGTPADAVTLTGNVMPGDKVSAKVVVKNTKDDIYYAVKMVVTVEGNEGASFEKWLVTSDADASATNMPTLTKNQTVTIDKSFVLDGTIYNNDYQTKAVTVSYEVRALQAKNITPAQAFAYITTGEWNDTKAIA